MRLFRSEEEAPGEGVLMPLPQLQEVARRWYGDRLEAGWRPRSREASQAILESVGLSGEFWRLP